MTLEREGLVIPENSYASLDGELFASFADVVGRQEVYSLLEPSGERKKQLERDFLASNHTLDVDLRVRVDDEKALIRRRDSIAQWKGDLLTTDAIPPRIMQLYRWRVNESIAGIEMALASNNGDMHRFDRWNEFIYGKPDEAVYQAALDSIASDAEALLISGANTDVSEAAEAVLERIGSDRGDKRLLAPDASVFEEVRERHVHQELGFYGLALAGVEFPDSGYVNNEQGDPIIRRLIANMESDYDLSDASGGTWSVSHEQKSIKRPAVYTMPAKRFIGLAAGHEIGSHLLEYVNGSRGPLSLLQFGLDRYEAGNEGRAVMREQVMYETFEEFTKLKRWRDIIRRHAAISFAQGVGAKRKRSFSETYAFINDIDTMYSLQNRPDDVDAAHATAHKETWNLLTRIMKGTDGNGGAFNKDIFYLEGNVSHWQLAANKGAEAIDYGDFGKYDLTNTRHSSALKELDVLPQEY